MTQSIQIEGDAPAFAIYSPKYFPSYVGGGERLVQLTAAALRTVGIRVVIISEGQVGEYEFDGIRVLTVPHANGDGSNDLVPYPDVLRQLLRQINARAVHTITVQGLSGLAAAADELELSFGMAAMDYGLVCGRRTLVRGDGASCSGCRPVEECFSCRLDSLRIRDKVVAQIGRRMPGSWASAISEGTSRLASRPLGHQLTWWHQTRLAHARLARAIDRLDVFLTPTRWNMDLARKRLPSGIASEVLSFPIPKELQSAECKTVPLGRLRVGFVGRPIPIKGIDVLIAAVERAHSLIPLELHMFCPRNDDEQSEYWQPLRERVRCLDGSIWSECGVFDVSALRAIHSTIDALALPSIWPDFFPFVTLEAQALGTPVLLSDFPSQRELFNEDQNTAWFVAPGDVDAWVNCLLSVWEAKRHGRLGRPVCRAPTLDQYAQTLLSTYERARRPFQIARVAASAYDA